MAGTVVAMNPGKPRRKRRRNPSNPARKANENPRRRRRRRSNPAHPVLAGVLGFVGGTLVGAGANVGLRYTALSPMARGGILLASGVVAAVGLSFVHPAVGGGVGGGLGAAGGTDLILELTAPKAEATQAAAESAPLSEVRAELGEVRVQLGKLARGAGSPNLLAERAGGMVEVTADDLIAAMAGV